MSRIAWAWISDRPNFATRPSFASFGSFEARISRMTASMWSRAIESPSRMCSRASAFRSRNRVRLVTTSFRKARNSSRSSLRFIVRGRFWTIASSCTPKEVCICVCLYRLLRTTSATASFFSSTTTRIPSRSDSSRRSEISSISLFRTSSAIRSMRRDLFTWYGISVTTIDSRSPFFAFSMKARARIWTLPRPVRYASRTPSSP